MHRFRIVLLLSSLAFALTAQLASAQHVVDPTALEFTASANHDALVLSYELQVFVEGSTSPMRVVELGKPSPNAAGTIRIPLRDILDPLSLDGTSYEVRIAAVGAGGSALSNPSNSFSFNAANGANAPCEYLVALDNRTMPFNGGVGSFSVSATAGCGWAASTSVGWITITNGGEGVGDGTVAFVVHGNPSTGRRSGAVTIAGQTTLVSQDGSGCSYTVSPTSRTVARAGATVSVSVAAPDGCDWSASAHSPWISVSDGGTGSGNGTVTLAVEGSGASGARSASVTVAGHTVVIAQPAATAPSAPGGMRIIGL